MMSNNVPLAHRVGSRFSGKLTYWWFTLGVWSLNSAVLLASQNGASSYPGAITANLISIIVVLALLSLWKIFITRHHEVIPVWTVVGAGALIGYSKGITTNLLFAFFTTGEPQLDSILIQSLPALVTGMWILPGIAIIGSILSDYEAQREILIAERVRIQLNGRPASDWNSDVADFARTARLRINDAAVSVETFREALRNLAELDLRTLSHRLWLKEEARVGEFRVVTMMKSAMWAHSAPALVLSLVMTATLIPMQVAYTSSSQSFMRGFVQGVIIYVLYAVTNRLPWRGKVSGPALFFATPTATVTAIYLVSKVFFGDLPRLDTAASAIVLWMGLVLISLMLGMVTIARKSHRDIMQQLAALDTVQLDKQATHAVRLIKRRELAEYLHGFVQNSLLQSAVRLSYSPESVQAISRQIEELLTQLEEGELKLAGQAQSIHDLDADVRDLWMGIISVAITASTGGNIIQTTCSLSCPCNLSSEEIDVIERVIHELVSNATRHGLANVISVSVDFDDEVIQLIAVDDGVGPRVGNEGLGSTLFSLVTQGKWSRELSSDGIGTRVVLAIAR